MIGAAAAARLEKLEKDLHFLTAMQELFLTNSAEACLNNVAGNQVPESRNNNSRKPRKQCNISLVDRDAKYKTTNVLSKPGNGRAGGHSSGSALDVKIDDEVKDRISDLEQEMSRVQGQLDVERTKRTELEDAGRRVALQLQKAEDELQRQTDTKQGLLVGTLQLKNQIQGYETRINQLELEIGNLKNEKQRLNQDLDQLNHEKQNLKQEIDSKTTEFERLKTSNQTETRVLKQEVTKLEACHHDIRRQLEIKDQSANQQCQKLLNQLNQMLVKCVKLEREREFLNSEMQKAKNFANEKETELFKIQQTLENLSSEQKRSQATHDSVVTKLESDIQTQNSKTTKQVTDCRALLSQTKAVLLQLRNEKAEGQGSINDLKAQNSKLTFRLQEMNKKIQILERDKQLLQERLQLLMSDRAATILRLEKENKGFQRSMKVLKTEKRNFEKEATEFKEIFDKRTNELEAKYVGVKTENNAIRQELSNTKDNFQIIQKISQDQISTIQKLKSERDEERKLKTELESELRESEQNEGALLEKLESEERKASDLESEVDYLEAKLRGMEADLRTHSCEAFVESTCRNRLAELEKTVKVRYAEWERTERSIKAERDRALAAARKATNTTEEMKTTCETRITDILSGTKQEKSRLQAENQRLLAEKSTKIYELESEMEKLRQMSANTQRGLTARIQQLQSALGLCLGGNPTGPAAPSFGLGNLNSNMNGFGYGF